MDITALAQPTTIIGLAGLAIMAVIYVTHFFSKIMEKKDKQFTEYVETNNHQKTELVQEATKVIVEAKESIKVNTESNRELTDSVKKLIDLHLTK